MNILFSNYLDPVIVYFVMPKSKDDTVVVVEAAV